MTNRDIVIGETVIKLHANGLTVTCFTDGATLPAYPHDSLEYLKRAREHGYGDDVAAMSRDHEIAHTLLAFMLTGKPSRSLWRAAHNETFTADDDIEEAAVMSFQRLARTRGIVIVDVAATIVRR